MVTQLVEGAEGMSLAYPAWLALACLALALACGYTVAWRPAQWKDRRWAGFVVTALLAFAARYFGSCRAQFDRDGARQRALFGDAFEFAWEEVRSVREERSRGKGRPCCLLVVATARGEFEFNTVDLDAGARDRLRRFIRERAALRD